MRSASQCWGSLRMTLTSGPSWAITRSKRFIEWSRRCLECSVMDWTTIGVDQASTRRYRPS
jgi:hypothetical protein